MTGDKRPVTVVTGYLGSGKTTLLSRVLAAPEMAHTVVLVNEFGAVSLDHHLLQRVDEQTVSLGGGCLCCNLRDDLVRALKELLNQMEEGAARIERVVIETTGLADPAPILFSILTDPVLQHHFYVERVVATVDALNGNRHLDLHAETTKQLIAADVIVVTKSDMASPGQVEELVGRLRRLNPAAQVLHAEFGAVDPAVISSGGCSLGGLAQAARSGEQCPGASHGSHGHLDTIRTLAITFKAPLDWTAFGAWFSMLLHARGEEVLRVKGIIDVGESGPVLLNGVQHVIHPPEHLPSWPSEDHSSRIVFIAESIRPETILHSLLAFQRFLGCAVAIEVVEGIA